MEKMIMWDRPAQGGSCYIHPSAVVAGEVTLSRDCSIWPQAVLRGDDGEIRVGPCTNIQDGVIVHGGALIGSRVTVGHRAVLHGCSVGDGALIGIGAIVLDGASIGEGAIIAAGAVVSPGSEIPPGSVVMGIPGRIRRQITPEEALQSPQRAAEYAELARKYANLPQDIDE